MHERERAPRRALRLPVTFWRRGEEDQTLSGYSMNVSPGGMFVATYRPLPPNAIVDLEIARPDGAVRASAHVVHAARYPAGFQRVFKSGMGLRFLQPDDPAIAGIASMGQLLADRGGRRRFQRRISTV